MYDGYIVEEYVSSTYCTHIDGEQVFVTNVDRLSTGRFYFRHNDGRKTKYYTYQTAPKWLRRLIDGKRGEGKLLHKVCTRCNIKKPINKFNLMRKGESVRKSICKECQSELRRNRKQHA